MAVDFSRKPAGFNTVTGKAKYETLAATLLERAESVCRYLLPDGRKENGEWRVGSIGGERGQSMGVNLKTGICKDFDAGDGAGDLLALWALKRGVKMHVAFEEAAEWAGVAKPKTSPAWLTPKEKSIEHRVAVEKDEPEDKWWIKVNAKKWDYFDADGVLWATVRRWDNPKASGEKRVRPWNPAIQDEKWPEGPRPLYNLFKLKASTGPVILVEGEKCADALIERGYVATTMAGGANAAKTIDWTPLQGRDVIRWADNDHPRADGKPTGRQKWVETTHGCLTAAGVKSIRDTALPGEGKPDGWDCADATDGEIKALIEGARTPPAPALLEVARGSFAVSDWDVGQVYTGEPPVLVWLVDKTIPLGKGGLLAAQGDAGKSMILLDLAMKVCMTPASAGNGGVWPYQALGHDVTAGGACVLLMAEDDKGEIHRRLSALDPTGGLREGCAGKLFIVAFPDAGGPPRLIMGDDKTVSATDEFEIIRTQLRAIKDLRLIGIDPTTPFVGGDLNKPHIAGTFATLIAQLAAETGATVVCTHHMTKGERAKPISSPEEARHAIRGAAAYVDGLRFAYAMWPHSKDEVARRIMHGFGYEFERNAVYFGAIVKINSKADREPKVFVRAPATGLLDAKTRAEVGDAIKVPMPASDEAMMFFFEFVKWHMNKDRATVFGAGGNPFSYYMGKGSTPKGFVTMPETEWTKLATELGLSKPPNKSDVSRAAKIIASEGPHPLCRLELGPKGYDYPEAK